MLDFRKIASAIQHTIAMLVGNPAHHRNACWKSLFLSEIRDKNREKSRRKSNIKSQYTDRVSTGSVEIRWLGRQFLNSL